MSSRGQFHHWCFQVKIKAATNVAQVTDDMLHACGGVGYKKELGKPVLGRLKKKWPKLLDLPFRQILWKSRTVITALKQVVYFLSSPMLFRLGAFATRWQGRMGNGSQQWGTETTGWKNEPLWPWSNWLLVRPSLVRLLHLHYIVSKKRYWIERMEDDVCQF